MKENHKGFSLLEVLVVLILLGSILGVILPTTNLIDRQKAKVYLKDIYSELRYMSIEAQKGKESSYIVSD